jgi:hypothetical protein
MMGLLRQISQAVGGQPRAEGFRNFDPQDPLRWGQGRGGDEVTPESLEEYAAASPSVDATNLAGLRGAGGWGYGTRSPGNAQTDFLDPSRRRLS